MKHSRGFTAITPIFLLIILFAGIGLLAGDFYRVPMLIVFIFVSAYTLFITRGRRQRMSLIDRLSLFSSGAGDKNLLQMIWIFVLAGAFAASARAMGSIDTLVSLTLSVAPTSVLLVGLFVAAILVSFSIGTSVGTIVAITPFAAALAQSSVLSVPLTVAAVVGGALFGDNLSFISDTTVAATQTQQIPMRDKFLANFRVAAPAAILTMALYVYIGFAQAVERPELPEVSRNIWLIVPYLYVLVAALAGMNVLAVLFSANLLTGLIGVWTGGYTWLGWTTAMTGGIAEMGELILISMMAGGLMSLIRYNGGVTYIIASLRQHVDGPRGAALMIGLLVSIVDFCTANNTIAILSTGAIGRDIADRYGVSRRRSASVLDIFSCCVQGLLPYGAQLLMAAGIAGINPIHIIPYLYYPFILLFVAILVLLFIPDKKG